MIRLASSRRPAAAALFLLALSAAGCAHFREAEERAALRQDDARAAVPAAAPAAIDALPPERPGPPPPEPAPAPVPQASAAAPVAEPPATEPPATESPATAPAPPAPQPAPRPAPASAPPAEPPAGAAAAPATGDAVIVFANVPGARCGACVTVKVTVAPSGQVLIEHGEWQGDRRDWRYRRSRARVGPARAAAFAASLAGVRPSGDRLLAGGGCAVPGQDGALEVEWLEADRHDRLRVNLRCPVPGDDRLIRQLLHAPDLLGMARLAFPWNAAR